MHEVIKNHHEQLKYLGDAVVIPSGVGMGLANYLELINGGLTTLVLITSLVWGIYRIIDMRNKQRRKKR